MKKQKIAVIGAGTAGLAVAAFLRRDQHEVTLFEKFDAPRPLGAGLLLQPTGLSVLALLGLDRQIIEGGSVIHQLYGKVAGGRWPVLDVKYRDFASGLFGVGVHRGNLFSALYGKAMELGVPVRAASEITGVEQSGGKAWLNTAEGEKFGEYDLVIDASGARSALRKKYAGMRLDRPYPYGAIWSIVKLEGEGFRLDTLEQRYKNAYHMIGILPVGRLNGDACTSAAFFWSMRVADFPRWREQELAQWQDYVIGLWPQTESLLGQFRSHDDLTLATYSDVILRRYHAGSLVFIGDAAHCTSPQLGQGANLGLMDAMVLAHCVREAESVQEALEQYSRRRKKHTAFYQMASRMLTPFFSVRQPFFRQASLLHLRPGLPYPAYPADWRACADGN